MTINLKDELVDYMTNKKYIVVNGIEADRVRDKKTGEYKGGTTIQNVYTDFIEVRIHNVKAESKTDKLIETEELVYIPFTAITTISVGLKELSQNQATLLGG